MYYKNRRRLTRQRQYNEPSRISKHFFIFYSDDSTVNSRNGNNCSNNNFNNNNNDIKHKKLRKRNVSFQVFVICKKVEMDELSDDATNVKDFYDRKRFSLYIMNWEEMMQVQKCGKS